MDILFQITTRYWDGGSTPYILECGVLRISLLGLREYSVYARLVQEHPLTDGSRTTDNPPPDRDASPHVGAIVRGKQAADQLDNYRCIIDRSALSAAHTSTMEYRRQYSVHACHDPSNGETTNQGEGLFVSSVKLLAREERTRSGRCCSGLCVPAFLELLSSRPAIVSRACSDPYFVQYSYSPTPTSPAIVVASVITCTCSVQSHLPSPFRCRLRLHPNFQLFLSH